ncbi:PREDICTED: shugoshin 2 [Hipposideros armiger]|uniref:Shugoshin 2 n=1 Tax=Hipposideros armiger TaxID=186990 RepID=A0A8B7QSB5_HIPAR|nr:PREDICTED: shugoshin 2 [Hipposideros armiger]XP_019491138.1 PREDICTED: shugoshin 2 [Hipposideros armiger]
MEYPAPETGSLLTSGIKRHVKDKRISRTAKLNVSLASKIKTKIINNSSIFKISLKHNNRALAQALSREKENSRRITTEKMLLLKEVEKLNFENTFLRLKLNNLNKKLIEIEALMNNNLITAIEMSTLSEFHQSPFLLPSEKKRVSKQCKSMHLPFARVPLTSNDDDDDDDDDAKDEMQRDNSITSKTVFDVPSSVSTRQPLSTQCNLESLYLKENNQNMCGLDDSEYISSTVDILPKESHSHSDQSSKSSLMNEMKNAQPISDRKEKPPLGNITKRKRRVPESSNPSADNPCVTDADQQWISSSKLNLNNEINAHTNEINIKMQRNVPCLPDSSESASEPTAECMNQVQGNDNSCQLQKTVYDADMDLTASEVSKIVTVSTGTKNKSNKKPNDCEIKTFRKVKDSSSEKKRERSKRQFRNSSDMNAEEKIENEPEKRSVGLSGKVNAEDPSFILNTEHLTQLNIRKTIALHNVFDQDDKQSTENSKKKRIHVTNEQEETSSFSQSSDQFQQESKFDMAQSSLAYNKSKASRQTFVIHQLEKGNLFLSQKDKETISENLEVTNEFQTADLATKHHGNLCDYEAQNVLNLKEHVTDMQTAQQNDSKINKKLRQKVNRKTEIISEMNQIYGDNDKDVHGPEKANFAFQTQKDKDIFSGNLEVSNEFQTPTLSTGNNRNPCDCEPQNVLGLQKLITDVVLVGQNESKVKNLRQKVNRKTVVISEVNNLYNEKNVYCPGKGNPFFLTQKDKEIIPKNLEDPSEFHTLGLSTKDSGNLCDYETQNVLGVQKHVHGMQPACQNESKIDRQKVCRKTEIISGINQSYGNDDKGMHDPENSNLFSLSQKDKEIIPENLEDSNEFQIANPSTRGNRNLCDYETQNILGEKKHVTDMPPAKQNGPKINKRLWHKGSRKTEIISEMNQINGNDDKGVDDPEKGNLFSLTQKDKETVSENPEVTNEFQTAYLSAKDIGNLYVYDTLNMMDLKKHVTDMQPAQQNYSKVNKLRQNINQKTEIISEMYQVYRDNDKDMHSQESSTKDLDFKVNESKQKLECQVMEISSNEKENCDQISNPNQRVKKHRKESSGKVKNILAKGKSKPILQLTDSSQTSLSFESGLKHITNEANADSCTQTETCKNPRESTRILSKKGDDILFVEEIKGKCKVKRGNKTTSKSKKRKTSIAPSPDSREVMEIISDTSQGISFKSDEEKNLETEKIKPDFYTKMFNSFSQIYSANIQDSSLNCIREGSRPLRIPSSKNQIIENFALENSPVFQVSDDVQEKMTEMKFNATRRTQKSGIGGRTLQELTNTSFVSNTAIKSESQSADVPVELPGRRRRCAPLHFKEPNLRDKMRR